MASEPLCNEGSDHGASAARGVRDENVSIFLYEDDDELAREVVRAFAFQGHDVTVLGSEEDVERIARRSSNSIFIMDRMVGNTDSLAMIGRLRASGSRNPVIVISSLVSVDDRIHGLRAGGDDYLIKPFSTGELVARVGALMRRSIVAVPETSLKTGDLVMDLIARTVWRGVREVSLLPREFSLLEFFMRRPNQVITRAMMLQEVWKYRAPMITNVVDVQISNLRRKIDGDSETTLIKNKRGVGFILEVPDTAD